MVSSENLQFLHNEINPINCSSTTDFDFGSINFFYFCFCFKSCNKVQRLGRRFCVLEMLTINVLFCTGIENRINIIEKKWDQLTFTVRKFSTFTLTVRVFS